jgi:hypothetical protein
MKQDTPIGEVSGFTVNPSFGGQIIKFDPAKPWGPGQQAPLTPEYKKVLEDSMADQARGGLGNTCERLGVKFPGPTRHERPR